MAKIRNTTEYIDGDIRFGFVNIVELNDAEQDIRSLKEVYCLAGEQLAAAVFEHLTDQIFSKKPEDVSRLPFDVMSILDEL